MDGCSGTGMIGRMVSTAATPTLRLSAVILDFDGVILDSETAEFEAYRSVFDRFGVTLTPEEWRGQIGIFVEGSRQRWHTQLHALVPNVPALDVFELEVRRRFSELLPGGPMAGILEMLSALERVGVPAAVASTSPASWVVPAATRIGIADRVRTIVSADDVSRRKPEPDVYVEALRRLDADPARTVAIEDSGPGVAAARAAGLKIVAIPHWLTEHHDLSGAHLRVSSAQDLSLETLEALLH